MSDFQQKDMSGILFKNERKSKDTQPDYIGSVTVKGTKFSLAGWIKEGKRGPYMSLAVKPWEDNQVYQTSHGPTKAKPDIEEPDLSDRIPF